MPSEKYEKEAELKDKELKITKLGKYCHCLNWWIVRYIVFNNFHIMSTKSMFCQTEEIAIS